MTLNVWQITQPPNGGWTGAGSVALTPVVFYSEGGTGPVVSYDGTFGPNNYSGTYDNPADPATVRTEGGSLTSALLQVNFTTLSATLTLDISGNWTNTDPGLDPVYSDSGLLFDDFGTIFTASGYQYLQCAVSTNGGIAAVNLNATLDYAPYTTGGVTYNVIFGGSESVLTVSGAVSNTLVPDLVADSAKWNTNGGLDIAYSLEGGALTNATSVALYWADGTNTADIISSEPIWEQPIPAEFAPGSTAQATVPASAFANPPAGATYVLLEVDPSNLVAEVTKTNNDIATELQLPDLVALSLTVDPSGTIHFAYTLTGAPITNSTTATLSWATGPDFEEIEAPMISQSIPEGMAVGSTNSVDVPSSKFVSSPYSDAPYVVLVLDPANLINEVTKANNVLALKSPHGAVHVNIEPADAVSAGAAWLLDHEVIERHAGETVPDEWIGPHTISFTATPGWIAPPDADVETLEGQTNIVTGTYTNEHGSLQVTLVPPEAVAAGARWRVDNGSFQQSGITVGNLSAGFHRVSFKPIRGWVAPAQEEVLVNSGLTTTTVGSYNSTNGALQVTLSPAAAAGAGAKWRVDGGSFHSSGDIVSNLSSTTHLLSFKPISGWKTPSNQSVAIKADMINTATGAYAETNGGLRVTIQPYAAVNAGARWRVDGGALRQSEATIPLAIGSHVVSFTAVAGWIKPNDQTVFVTGGATTETTGLYIATNAEWPTNISLPTNGSGDGLTILVAGDGTIEGEPDNPVDGHAYTLTAVPAGRNLFVNWVGGTSDSYSVLSLLPKLTFVMQSNLVLEANFTTNLFLAGHGTYRGLFAPTNSPREQTNSGAFVLTVGANRSFSGSLQIGSQVITLSGTFTPFGVADIISRRAGTAPSLSTTLNLDFTNECVTGVVSDGSFVAELKGYIDWFGAQRKATNFEGRYTIAVQGTTEPAQGPYGFGYGAATVSATGAIAFIGNLADGTAISQSSVLSQQGWWPMYVNLYGGKGSLWAWNYFTNHSISSSVSWINGGNAAANAVLRAGFTNQSAALAAFWYNPLAQPLLGLTNGNATLDLPSWSSPMTNPISISDNDRISAEGGASKLKLTLNKTTGVLSGSFVNPENPSHTIKVGGVVLQGGENSAAGFFIETNLSGSFFIWP